MIIPEGFELLHRKPNSVYSHLHKASLDCWCGPALIPFDKVSDALATGSYCRIETLGSWIPDGDADSIIPLEGWPQGSGGEFC